MNSDPVNAGSVIVDVGKVIPASTKSLRDLGFSVVSDSSTSLLSVLANDSDASFVSPAHLDSRVTVDTTKLAQIEDRDDLYLKIVLQYSVSDSSLLPTTESLELFPSNYDYLTFDAEASADIHTSTKASPVFYFPMKAKSKMNLYDLACMDSTVNATVSYSVPITLRFHLSNLNTGLLNANASYRITYSLCMGENKK